MKSMGASSGKASIIPSCHPVGTPSNASFHHRSHPLPVPMPEDAFLKRGVNCCKLSSADSDGAVSATFPVVCLAESSSLNPIRKTETAQAQARHSNRSGPSGNAISGASLGKLKCPAKSGKGVRFSLLPDTVYA